MGADCLRTIGSLFLRFEPRKKGFIPATIIKGGMNLDDFFLYPLESLEACLMRTVACSKATLGYLQQRRRSLGPSRRPKKVIKSSPRLLQV